MSPFRVFPLQNAMLSAMFLVVLLVLHSAIATPILPSRAVEFKAGDVLGGKCNSYKTLDRNTPVNSEENCFFVVLSSNKIPLSLLKSTTEYIGFMTSGSKDISQTLPLFDILKRPGFQSFYNVAGSVDQKIFTVPVTATSGDVRTIGRGIHLEKEALDTLKMECKFSGVAQHSNFKEGEVYWGRAKYFKNPDGKVPIDTNELCAFIPQKESKTKLEGHIITANPPPPTLPGKFLSQYPTTFQLEKMLIEHKVGRLVYATPVTIAPLKLKFGGYISPKVGDLITPAVAQKIEQFRREEKLNGQRGKELEIDGGRSTS